MLLYSIYLGVCLQAAHDETVVCKSVVNYTVCQQDGHIGSPIEQMHSLCDYVEIILYGVLATFIVGIIAAKSRTIVGLTNIMSVCMGVIASKLAIATHVISIKRVLLITQRA